jgi:acetyltransferase-like isoleucine patch superfamily enzyme
MNSFYTLEELKERGFKSLGKKVYISKKCSIYGAENISIGNNVRVDDFCILSGKISIGNYVHISAYSSLYGKGGISIGNFCGISPRSTIYSSSDDFSGEFMISPMVPPELTNVKEGNVILKDYCQLGANTIVMPCVTIGEGTVTGAFSLVLKDLKEWAIYFGIPSKIYKKREKRLVKLSQALIKDKTLLE